MAAGDTVRQGDIWRRDRDSVEVYVEVVCDSLEEGQGRLVEWGEVDSHRENVCTEAYFVRAYTLVERPA